MRADVDELQEAGEILLTLRQALPKSMSPHVEIQPRPVTPTEPLQAPRTPPMASWSLPVQQSPTQQQQQQPSPRSLDGRLTPPYGYPPYMPYVDPTRVNKRMFNESDAKYFVAGAPYYQAMQPMASAMLPHPMHFAMAQQRAHMSARFPVVESDAASARSNTFVHRVLCSQLAKTLADKLGYGTIQPFRPVDKEYALVFEGVRTMFFSKNKKAAWRTTYRNFLDYIGVKTRKFPPSWWCVSNKDITPEQREKCMRLLLTIGVEILTLLDECGHGPLQFYDEVDASKLQGMGLSIRDDASYWQFWEKDWKELTVDVKFESAASMWYLATFNRSLSFLGDGVLKFMTFLIVRRCDFFRVHTGKHAQGKVAKRYIMSSNSMSNSYARLMSIQLLDHNPRAKPAQEAPSSPSSSPEYTAVSPSYSPLQDGLPDAKRARVEG